MNIGIDLDGVITVNNWYKGHAWLPWWFILCGLVLLDRFILPRQGVVSFLRDRKANGDRIIIISARPENPHIRLITKLWLARYGIPYDKLILVGAGKGLERRKLAIIKEMKIGFYLDDDRQIVGYLRQKLEKVRVYCFGTS